MDAWERLGTFLPMPWAAALEALPPIQRQNIQEIRIRAGQPLAVTGARGRFYVGRGCLSRVPVPGVPLCSPELTERCVGRLCEDSVYAHQEELKEGFVTLPGGIRVGIAGRAVRRDNEVESVHDITSLCVRLPRSHPGCAAALLPYVLEGDSLTDMLLVGEPSSGKTTLLRDLARQLAHRGCSVAVVDERGELAGDGLEGCDVLQGYPKAVGIRQAVRCLAPQAVIFDELGSEEEAAAVAACAHAGVAVAASVHGRDGQELSRQPMARHLIETGVFRNWVFLSGRHRPGRVRACAVPEVIDNEVVWTAADGSGGAGLWPVWSPAADRTGENAADSGAASGRGGTAYDLYPAADCGSVAAAGCCGGEPGGVCREGDCRVGTAALR